MELQHVNFVNIIGQLTNEPRISESKKGKLSARFCIKTSETYLNEKGKTLKKSNWHYVRVSGRLVDLVMELGVTSQAMAVQGKMETRFFRTKSGRRKSIHELVANELIIL